MVRGVGEVLVGEERRDRRPVQGRQQALPRGRVRTMRIRGPQVGHVQPGAGRRLARATRREGAGHGGVLELVRADHARGKAVGRHGTEGAGAHRRGEDLGGRRLRGQVPEGEGRLGLQREPGGGRPARHGASRGGSGDGTLEGGRRPHRVVEVPRAGDEERRRLLRPGRGRDHHAAPRPVRVRRGLLQDADARDVSLDRERARQAASERPRVLCVRGAGRGARERLLRCGRGARHVRGREGRVGADLDPEPRGVPQVLAGRDRGRPIRPREGRLGGVARVRPRHRQVRRGAGGAGTLALEGREAARREGGKREGGCRAARDRRHGAGGHEGEVGEAADIRDAASPSGALWEAPLTNPATMGLGLWRTRPQNTARNASLSAQRSTRRSPLRTASVILPTVERDRLMTHLRMPGPTLP